ncbi:MAG: ParB/RepB/Spo0J family partition protein [Candidatus Fimadaptatus sp.]
MARSRGLGRGLDALIPTAAPKAQEQPAVPQREGEAVLKLSLADIDPNREQPRKRFETEALEQLAQSMRNVGVLQPIIVSATEGGRYRIIAGERRWRAARLAGLSTIPAIVRDMDAAHTREAALIENLQRDDLNPVEEAQAIRQLMDDFGATQEQIAGKLGKSRPAIANAVRLLTLPDEVLELVREGKLTAGHARALVVLDAPERQIKLALMAVEKGWTVRQIEAAAQLPAGGAEHKRPPRLPELTDMERMAREVFGTRAQMSGTLEKGKLTLSYYSRDDLDRIYEVLEIIQQSEQ